VQLHATLTPERLGQRTTIGFGFLIAAPPHQVPSPLTQVDVSYPHNLGVALSGLGLASCTQPTLVKYGPEGCSAESRMGYGTALAEIPVGPEILTETAQITVVRAPINAGHIALLFYANADTPILAQLVFPGLLLPAPNPYGGRINVQVPLVPSLPGAPPVAVVQLHATIGPEHITYYEHLHGKIVPYQPNGILLPNSCPHGGFQFAATFGFLDGTHAKARTAVSCPRHAAAG
jgi:hypothetical protein